VDNEGVERSLFVDLGRWSTLEVLLFVLAGLWVLVLENEMDLLYMISNQTCGKHHKIEYLVGGSALVRTKHNDIGRGVGELLSV
jgi:hypothetical protein